ncbi:PAS domain S-box-containing protein [Pseudorhizobium tarimense]|uniref:histidine kinase n=1 Tax=Pseudorhizobium tarimense TaxID=1079109 RepID=A0ABV2HAV2_9HYPH|nr:PAS domain-containing sensor histidine kinase [Pseudorhizobium tarimense]MCJ8520806.1 PAS domain S-box protein [Pseudorhizobium tarimense]
MSVTHYPFIDIAVHEEVSRYFAAGEAVVLFSSEMTEVVWANGRGARLFGYDSVYDFLDRGPFQQDLSFRQMATAGRRLREIGESAPLTIRTTAGFRRITVTGACRLIDVCGQAVVLYHAATEADAASMGGRASSMIEGLDDPGMHLAVIDDEGVALANSAGFPDLALTPQTARMLVTMAGSEASGLVKRPVPTAKGYLPAAMAKVASDPGLHLLFVVEAAAPGVDQPPADDTLPLEDREDLEHNHIGEEPPASTDFEEAIDAVSHLEDLPEPDEFVTLDLPAKDPDDEEAALSSPSLPPEAQSSQQSDEVNTADLAPPRGAGAASNDFVFRRDARATRFVWKIDAEGRFCEISEELAKTVGPHAADISGMAFSDVAALFYLDPDGKIGELLLRRDTWSGKTIWWPVEGTSLSVPIDLAALPTYTRDRTFDGFRGFGIIRVSDAIEDPNAVGLTLARSLPAAASSETPPAEESAKLVERAVEDDALAGELTATDAEAPAAEAEEHSPQADERSADQASNHEPEAAEEQFDWPKGERPALRLVENRLEASDKVIPLSDRRTRRESLSPVEQAAFREIARQLDSFIGKRDEEDGIKAPQTTEAANALSDDAAADNLEPTQTVGETPADPVTSMPEPDDDRTGAVDVEFESAVSVQGEVDSEADEEAHAPAPEEPIEEQSAPADDQDSYGSLYRKREGLTGEVLDQMPVALLVHSGDRLIHGNPEFLRLTGYASIEALAEVGGLDALLQRQDLEGKTEESGGMIVVRRDDTIVPVTARLQSVYFEQASALMLALMPVAEPHGAQTEAPYEADVIPLPTSQLPEQNARLQVEVDELRAILETATDGVVVIDAEGQIRSMNGAASALFNYDSEEASGKPFVMLFAHESQRAIVDYLSGLSGHGVASVLNDGREVIGREASGGFIPLFMTIGRLSSSNGYCAVIRDITQWKRTEEELRTAKRSAETANAHKSEFLAHVSHEIRTPLNAIIGFADLMATERFGPIGHHRYVEYANDIVRSGRHVLDIVNDLLDISKIEAGEMELDFVSVDLNETVSEAVSLVQPQANSQRVIIRTALSPAVPPVVADQRSVKQIALNILSNAIRFTPSGGQIVVSTVYEPNGSVVLRIRDTGIGMTRQELETAMKPFQQVAPSTRKRGDGTGLGLPLTKAMVDANRADFTIQSTPREGTLVEIAFPPQRVLAN